MNLATFLGYSLRKLENENPSFHKNSNVHKL